MTNFESLFKDFSSLRVGVVGDVMLDTYWWGNVERISPEAPVPIVALHHREQRIGGAGNVALNAVSLGAETSVFSVTGDDADSNILNGLLNKHDINTQYLVKSGNRITTNKIRVMSRNQQMLRIDSEIVNDISRKDEQQLLDNFSCYVRDNAPSVVIFEDYNKGVLSPTLIQSMIQMCKKHDIVTAVDPKRKNFFLYQHVDIFKPNLKEVKDGLNILVDDLSQLHLNKIHEELYKKLHHKISLITLSEKGVFVQCEDYSDIIPAHIRNVADVSGAGDTVIAVASLVYAATKDISLTAEIANLAGGIVCEEVGTVAIQKDKLFDDCLGLLLTNSGTQPASLQ